MTNHESTTPSRPAVPRIVEVLLVFFYILIWLSLLINTYLALAYNPTGNTGFLLPVGLYMLLLAGYPLLNWLRRRQAGSLAAWLWGHDDERAGQVVYILLC